MTEVHRLIAQKIDTLHNYYRNGCEGEQGGPYRSRSVLGSLYHMASTADDPNHALKGRIPGAATIQTRTTIGTSMGHWSRAHRTMCPDGEGSWCGYNTDQDNYRHKYETLE